MAVFCQILSLLSLTTCFATFNRFRKKATSSVKIWWVCSDVRIDHWIWTIQTAPKANQMTWAMFGKFTEFLIAKTDVCFGIQLHTAIFASLKSSSITAAADGLAFNRSDGEKPQCAKEHNHVVGERSSTAWDKWISFHFSLFQLWFVDLELK